MLDKNLFIFGEGSDNSELNVQKMDTLHNKMSSISGDITSTVREVTEMDEGQREGQRITAADFSGTSNPSYQQAIDQ